MHVVKGVYKYRTGRGPFFVVLIIVMVALAPLSYDAMGYTLAKVHSDWMVWNLKDYRIRHSHGIEYHFKADDLNYMDDLAETTQKVIGEVDGNFKRGESKPFKMVIYPNDMELNTGIKAPSREKTLGAYYGGNIFLLSPTELSGTETPIENVILHEYTHLLVEELTRGRHPVWLTEGIALLQEYLITGYQWGRTGRRLPYSLDDLEAHFYRLDTHHAYHSSFYRVRYLEETYGHSFLLELLSHLGKGKTYTQSIESLLAKDVEDLEKDFMLWYQGLDYDKL